MNEPDSPSQGEAVDLRDLEESLMRELVKLRKKRKISQQPIAEAIGVSQVRVSQMENLKGGVTLESVLIYARAIGANIVVVPENQRKKKDLPSSEA